ncbi:MAG: hypothetical protein ACQEXE_16720 [Bacillota bacterium]
MNELNSQEDDINPKDMTEYYIHQMELTKIKNNLNQAQKIANIGSLE